jgi:hypothetical protein
MSIGCCCEALYLTLRIAGGSITENKSRGAHPVAANRLTSAKQWTARERHPVLGSKHVQHGHIYDQ